MPSVLPRELRADEVGTAPLAAAERRVGAGDVARQREMSARVCSAAAMVLAVGALTTAMPAFVAAVEVDVVDADAGAADHDQAPARSDRLGVDLDLAAHEQRVVVRQRGQEFVARQVEPLVDLVFAAQQVQPLAPEGLGDKDPHAPAATGSRASASAAWPAARAAAAPRAGSVAMPSSAAA